MSRLKIEDITDEFAENVLSDYSAEELIRWALEGFGDRCAIGTSFQLTGSVIIDLASKVTDDFRLFTVDTLRLHDETYEIMDAVEERYGLEIERYTPDEDSISSMIERFGEYLFFTDKAKQEYCCHLRKVVPNEEALKGLDVWITGLRRDQSGFRYDVPKAHFVEVGGRRILKLAPLVDWSGDDVKGYIEGEELPYNKLFDQGYDSIGCIICSTPLIPGEEPRAGRWRWFNSSDDNKECGIHIASEGGSK